MARVRVGLFRGKMGRWGKRVVTEVWVFPNLELSISDKFQVSKMKNLLFIAIEKDQNAPQFRWSLTFLFQLRFANSFHLNLIESSSIKKIQDLNN